MADNEQEEKSISPGRRKAAAFLLSLDSEASAKILGVLGDREISALTEEMSQIKDLTHHEIDDVWDEFNALAQADVVSVEPMLQSILERALGKEKAKEMLEKIRLQSRDMQPFRTLRNLDSRQIETVLSGEHPQVLAIVMNYLDPAVSFEFLKNLDEGLRYEVIRRITMTDEMPVELIRQIDEIIEVRAFSLAAQQTDRAGDNRFKTVAQMLNVADPSITKTIMDKLTKDLPEEAENIQALMFVFEDLIKVSAKDMQKVLGEIDKNDLALALKAAPEEIANHIMDNLSKRARDNIVDEIELMGPKPLSEVEAAQKSILEVVRGMEDRGDIQIQRGSSEELV